MSAATPTGITRAQAARVAANRITKALTAERRVGLITYGGDGSGCDTVRTRLHPQAEAGALILGEIDRLRPGGWTPLAAAVTQAVEMVATLSPVGRVVVMTDGEANCNVDPCATARILAERHPGIQVHVVGFQYAARATEAMRCLTETTSGRLSDAQTTEELEQELATSLGCLNLSQRTNGQRIVSAGLAASLPDGCAAR